MLQIRKIWTSSRLVLANYPRLDKVAKIALTAGLVTFSVHVALLFDGTQLIKIGSKSIPVECKGYCPDKD